MHSNRVWAVQVAFGWRLWCFSAMAAYGQQVGVTQGFGEGSMGLLLGVQRAACCMALEVLRSWRELRWHCQAAHPRQAA